MNRICKLFGIRYPIIQGGMVWCSGWRLAAAVSQAGGLGLLGAGSMHPETLVEHIRKMKASTDRPWGVNVPLMYPEIDRLMDILIREEVKIVFTLTLIPQVRRATGLPVVAAGGIGSGEAMLAAMALGAEGVQIGTLFALSAESSASEAFKQRCLALDEGGTMLCLKKLSPTRLVRNGLFDKVAEAEARGANSEELRDILGKAASKRGIFEGDTEQGELEIGQIASSVDAIRPAGDIVRQLVEDFRKAQKDVAAIGF